MTKVTFILSALLIISMSINIIQILNSKYKYNRLQNLYLKKEKRLLEKAVKQNEEIIALQNRKKIREIR